MSEKRYTEDHEWVMVAGDAATIGISNHAQEQLGDIVFIELPAVGKRLEKGKEAAVVESVKAASEIYAPADGQLTAENAAMPDEPGSVHGVDGGHGWVLHGRSEEVRVEKER